MYSGDFDEGEDVKRRIEWFEAAGVAPAGSGGNGTVWTLAREIEDRTCTTEDGIKEGVTPSVCSEGTVPGGRTAKIYGSMNAGRTPFRCLEVRHDNQPPPVSSGGAAQSILSGREGVPSVFKKCPTSSGI